jgi:lipid-binding SYLF domain-containing protein
MNKRYSLATLALVAALAACSTTNPNVASEPAAERSSIDADVNGALGKLYAQEPGSRAMVAKSRGVLVFPGVVSAGFVVGGSYGKGELLVGGRPDGYYSTTAGSVGLLAGADSKAVYILFMTEESLDKFRASKGWTAGADASVSLIKAGADAGIDTQTMKQPVVAYVLTNGGLMANLSIDGTKISRLSI